jgi:predicted transcriptional regulator
LPKQKTAKKPRPQMRLAKAISLYVRVDILRILYEREASPKELSAMLDENLSYISYHIRQLLQYQCIEEVRTEQRRGALEHFYRATTWPFVSDQEAEKQTKITREEISVRVLQVIFSEAARSLDSGIFDARTDRHVSWMPIDVDERGWAEIIELQLKTLEKYKEIEARNAKRLEKSDETPIEMIVSMLGFERSENPLSA